MQVVRRYVLTFAAVVFALLANKTHAVQESIHRVTALTSVSTGLPPINAAQEKIKAWVRTRDGHDHEGSLTNQSFSFLLKPGESQTVSARQILSFCSADPASEAEAARIADGIKRIVNPDVKIAEPASVDLTEIGLPVLSSLLKDIQDTDAHEPDFRYRLFGRIIPGYADGADRSLDFVRLLDGEFIRGKWVPTDIELIAEDDQRVVIPASSVRRIAIEQPVIHRTFELQALDHSLYVGWLDTGIAVRPSSSLIAEAQGFARLSFDEDGWAADPEGIYDPLPGKRRLQEGFRWGAILGRVGPSGERWFAGKQIEKSDLGSGRLFFVINDNEHWQNNIGSYRMRLEVKNAYDLGDPR